MENLPQSCNKSTSSETTTRRTFLQHCSLPAWIALTGTLAPSLTTTAYAQEVPPVAETSVLVAEPPAPIIVPKDQFKHIAQLLTGNEQLNDALLEKALVALQKNNPQFESTLNELYQLMDAEAIVDAQALMQSKTIAQQPAAVECAQQIARALYTGRVGRGGKSELITYEQALMYHPTIDITVIPSYSRGGRDYWIKAPV